MSFYDIHITPVFATYSHPSAAPSSFPRQAELRFLHDISIGAFTLEAFTMADVHRCGDLLRTYADLNLGLADAAVIATAERLGIPRILTVDERDFRAVRSNKGTALTLLPTHA